MKLNPNMTFKEAYNYCVGRNCNDCKFYKKPYCTLGRPYSFKFEEQPQVREIKRAARIGEYIKIVNAYAIHIGYDNGDIVKVISRFDSDKVRIDRENSVCVLDSEYVVLENYSPIPTNKPQYKFNIYDSIKYIDDAFVFPEDKNTVLVCGINGGKFIPNSFPIIGREYTIFGRQSYYKGNKYVIFDSTTLQYFVVGEDGLEEVEQYEILGSYELFG